MLFSLIGLQEHAWSKWEGCTYAHDSCEIWDFKGMGTLMQVHCDIIW